MSETNGINAIHVADMREWRKTFLARTAENGRVIAFKTLYADIARDTTAGLLLSQISYWHLDKAGNNKLTDRHQGALWISKMRTQWFAETRLTEDRFDTALAVLLHERLVFADNFRCGIYGGSVVKHIRINWPVFRDRVEEIRTIYSSCPADESAATAHILELWREAKKARPRLSKTQTKSRNPQLPDSGTSATHIYRDDLNTHNDNTYDVSGNDDLQGATATLIPIRAAPNTPKSSKTLVPLDFAPSAESLEWLDKLRADRPNISFDVALETDGFLDHWRSGPGKGRKHIDWQQAWRKWMRDAVKYAPAVRVPKAPPAPRAPQPFRPTQPRKPAVQPTPLRSSAAHKHPDDRSAGRTQPKETSRDFPQI